MPKSMPVGNISVPLSARENASVALKKRESLLRSKVQALPETNKQLQFLGKDDLKKQMIKNKSLSLKLHQKIKQIKKNR